MPGRAVIIGSGLGGLECGLILARQGYEVCILEKNPQHPGGCLQSFSRGGLQFDCGMHYVGGLAEGESLHRLFEYFGLLDLPWRQINPDCVDEIVLDGVRYPLASGYDNFIEKLAEIFPHERENLQRFVDFLKSVGEQIFDSVTQDSGVPNPLFGRSAWEFLQQSIGDPTLRKVLSGAFMRMELSAETLPLYPFAQINNSFLQSAWKLDGGGHLIAGRLAEQIEALGGRIVLGAEASRIVLEGGKAAGVEAGKAGFFPADIIVSDIHPAATMALLGEDAPVRKVYRQRIDSLPCSFGVFTANIALKKGALPYRDSNIYVYAPGADPWLPREGDRVMVYFYPSEDGFAGRLDLMAPMSLEALEPWRGKTPGARGEDYEALKAAKLEECLSLASGAVPGLRNAVDRVWTSTPLSWEHYTGTPGGSAFGIRKDWQNPLGTLIPSRTPVPGLWLTGQNLNLAGLLGVSITAALTCKIISKG